MPSAKGDLLHFVLLRREAKGLDLFAPGDSQQRIAAANRMVEECERSVALERQQPKRELRHLDR